MAKKKPIKEPAKMGRPPIEIDWDEMDKLMMIQSTKQEISGWFRCSEETLENKIREKYDMTFSALFAERSQGGKISLRRKQFQTAMSGSVPLLIWLGKNMLKQTDKLEEVPAGYSEQNEDKLWELRDASEME